MAKGVTENYDVTYYAADKKDGVTVQAVASVREGSCVLNCHTHRPTLVSISYRKSRLPLVIYVERGEKILISGEDNDPMLWKVEGNEINRELSVWREENSSLWKDCIPDSVNAAVKKYVEQNNNNPVATILMQTYYNRGVDERGYNELMGALGGEAKKSVWLRMCGRADQLTHSYFLAARLESWIARAANPHGKDTLRINEKDPVLVAFWQNGFIEKKELVDSLKQLKKEVPDSVRIIADVYADIDSLAWKNSIRRDSLDFIKRFWAPMGMQDPALVKFKVNSLPYYIVFDKHGSQCYRGDDLSEALKKYRNLRKYDSSSTSKP